MEMKTQQNITPAEQIAVPIDMILPCPKCGTLHIDAPDFDLCECGHGAGARQHSMMAALKDCWHEDCECVRFKPKWNNPPHKSHLCHNCRMIWRPADVPTNGVAEIKTRGEKDSWPEVTR